VRSGLRRAAGVDDDERVWTLGEHTVYPSLFDGSGFLVLLDALRRVDPALLALSVLGALAALGAGLRRRARADGGSSQGGAEAAVLAAYAVPMLVIFGLYGGSRERFFVPLAPYLALLAAYGVSVLAAALTRGEERAGLRRLGGAVLALLALSLPAATSLQLARLRAATDTYELAAQWLQEHDVAERGRVLAGNLAGLPVRQAGLRQGMHLSWGGYQRAHWGQLRDLPVHGLWYPTPAEVDDVLAASAPRQRAMELLEERRPRYALVSPNGAHVEFGRDERFPHALRRAVQQSGGRLQQVISPVVGAGAEVVGLEYYLGVTGLTELARLRRLGRPSRSTSSSGRSDAPARSGARGSRARTATGLPAGPRSRCSRGAAGCRPRRGRAARRPPR